MKILVTGGAGFIGSHLVDRFIEQGDQVVVVDDLSTGHPANLNSNARFYKIDIRDAALEEIFRDERPDIVSHHAAQMNVRRSVGDPLLDISINIVGTVNVLQQCTQYGVQKTSLHPPVAQFTVNPRSYRYPSPTNSEPPHPTESIKGSVMNTCATSLNRPD